MYLYFGNFVSIYESICVKSHLSRIQSHFKIVFKLHFVSEYEKHIHTYMYIHLGNSEISLV